MGFSLKLSVHFMLFCSDLQCKYDQFYITNTLVYFVGMLCSTQEQLGALKMLLQHTESL